MDRSVSVASSASAPPSERSDSTTDVNHVLPMSTWLQQTNNYHSNNGRRVHTGFSSSDSESSSTTRSENAARDPPPAMPMNTWLESVSTLAAGHQKVHTGFTSSDSESFSSASSSRDGGGGEAAPVKLSVLFSRPQYVAGGPLPHTGFTTSESSASSRSSSPPGGAATHHSKQMILDHAAKKNTTRPGPISTTTLVAEEGTRVRGGGGGGGGSDGAAVVTSSHDISQQSLGVMGTFQAVFPTRPSFTSFEAPQSVEPRKADATPRRKVSPSAGSSGNTPYRGLPSSTVQRVPLLDRRPLSEVDGAIGSNSNVNISSTSMMTSSARLDSDRSALPPSTLLDLQANLSLQSDIRLRVREEELIKELSRTRRELLRRGMAMTAYMGDEMGLPQGGDGGRKISVASSSSNPTRQRHSQQQPEPSTEGGAAARSDYNERVALDDGSTNVATSRGYSTRKSFTGEVLVTQPAPPSSSAAYLKEYAQRLLNVTSHGGDYGFASSSVQSTPGAGKGQGPSNRQQQNTDTSLDRNADGSDVEAEWVGRRDEGMQHASRQGSAVTHQWTSKKAVVGSNVLSTTKNSNSYYTDHDHNITTTATSSGALSPLLRSPILHVGKRQHYNEQSRPLTPRAISSSFSQQQHDVPATESAAVWSELLALKRIRETQR